MQNSRKDHVQQILDIDPPGQPAQRAGGEAKLLGDDVLAARRPFGQGAFERGLRIGQETAVAFPADQRRLAAESVFAHTGPKLRSVNSYPSLL